MNSAARRNPRSASRFRRSASSPRVARPCAIWSTERGSTSPGRAAGDFRQRGQVRGQHRHAAGHRLEHRQAEALVQRRIGEHGGRREQAYQFVTGYVAGRDHLPGSRKRRHHLRERRIHPAVRADQHQRERLAQPGRQPPERLHQPQQVLARLQRAHRQHETAPPQAIASQHRRALGRVVRPERGLDAEMDRHHLVVRQPELLVDRLLRVAAHGDHPARLLERARQALVQVADGGARMKLRMGPMRQVVDRHHGRPAIARGDEVGLVVHEAATRVVVAQARRHAIAQEGAGSVGTRHGARHPHRGGHRPARGTRGLGGNGIVAHQRLEILALVDGRSRPTRQRFDIRPGPQAFEQVLRVVADTATRRPQGIQVEKQLHAVGARRAMSMNRRGPRAAARDSPAGPWPRRAPQA